MVVVVVGVVVVVVVVVIIVVVVVVVVAVVAWYCGIWYMAEYMPHIAYGITHAANLIMCIPWRILLLGQRISHMAHRMP